MVSAVDLEETQRKCTAAEAALKAAKAKLNLLEDGPRPEEVTQAEAEVKAAAAEDALAGLHLEQCAIKAPIEGELVKIAVHPGMELAATSPVATVVDLRRVLVQAVIPASRLSEVRLGNSACITTAARPDQSVKGRVVRISEQADADTGNVPIWIAVSNTDKILRQDMVVRAL